MNSLQPPTRRTQAPLSPSLPQTHTSASTTIQKQKQEQYKQYYLIAYNLLSALLWTAVLGRVLLLIPLVGFEHVYGGVGEFARGTQTLAVLEVGHAAFGLIRSPLPTTAMQVLSRLALVYLILTPAPLSTTTQPSLFYSTMLLAWSLSEIIRYSYFVFNLQNLRSGVPGWLVWARYNAFYVLYPLGTGSECVLVSKASLAAGREGWTLVQWGLWGLLVVYVPGFYVLFQHMRRQRRKVMRGKGVERR